MLKKENIFSRSASHQGFSDLALEVFSFQHANCSIYRQWCDLLKIKPEQVKTIEKIPFLPIEFFKKFEVVSSPINPETIKFSSSATTSQTPATHFVNDITIYETSFLKAFNLFYGAPSDYCILALLPNYLQRGGSSLVYMCDKLIKASGHPSSGFFLDNVNELIDKIKLLNE